MFKISALHQYRSSCVKLPLAAAVAISAAVGSPASLAEDSILALEEVIVTARKREEGIQDVPISVTSIGEALRDSSVRRLEDIQSFTPNVAIRRTPGTPGGVAISIRGVSYQEIDKSFDPAIGVIMDGMYLGTSSGSLLQNFDTARVEVLRGPQGTLFGKNTIGGVINVIRGEPTMEWGLDASVTVGTEGRNDYEAVVNVPVSEDKVGLKLFAASYNSDGYIRNTTLGKDVGGDKIDQYGFTALYHPTEDVSLKLFVEQIKLDSDTGSWANMNTSDDLNCIIGLATPVWTPAQGCEAFDTGSDETHVSTNFHNPSNSDIDSYILTANWDVGDYQLTSITGYRKQNEKNLSEFDASSAEFLYLDYSNIYDQTSQELRLTSQFSDKIEFVAGLYYWKSNYEQHWDTGQLFYALDQSGFLVPGLPPGAAGIPEGYLGRAGQKQETTSYAGFFSGDWHINEQWTLTAGVRATYEKKDFEGSETVNYTPPQPVPPLVYTSFDDDWNEVSPKVGFRYQYDDEIMVFGTFTQGFKSGGYFGRNTNFTATESYDPETVDTYELGIKSTWMGRRLIFNPSFFYSEYKDKQEEVLVPVSNTEVATNVSNAGEQELWGVELEVQFQVTEALSLRANYGYLDSKYKEFDADLNGDGTVTDNSDRTPRNSPENTFGLVATYDMQIGPGDFQAFAAYRWRDEIEVLADNNPSGHLDSIDNLDITLNYSWNDDRYRVSAFARNLTDETEAQVTRINGLTRWAQWTQGDNYGVEFTIDF